MSFEDEEKKKQAKRVVKAMGFLMAIGFMLLAVFVEKLGPIIGFSQALSSSTLVKYMFFAIGIMDLIVFTFVFK